MSADAAALSSARAAPAAPSPEIDQAQSSGTSPKAAAILGHGPADLPNEHFIPVTRFALMDRLTAPAAWPAGVAKDARRFFRYLDYWRTQQYSARVLALEQIYEPFSPDSDLLITREYSAEERTTLLRRLVDGVEQLLTNANYTRIPPERVEFILTPESEYGLDLDVDLEAFDELLVYYRGASKLRNTRRTWRKFLRKEQFDVPIYRRFFILFKLKPFDVRVAEVMRKQDLSRAEAERLIRKRLSTLPVQIKRDYVYLKLFKNIPRSDVEMVFPNTRVKFRLFDKLKLGVTGGAGLGLGAFGAAGKIAVAVISPLAALTAVAGLGGIAFRQAMNFVNLRQRYMVIMAQNLYFHSMSDNRSAMIKLAYRAAEEDVKEEMLLYCVLAKESVNRADLPAVDRAIEKYLAATFGIDVDFDVMDAYSRLTAEGLVTEDPDGTLRTLPPHEAALHIDAKWDKFLDDLPDVTEEGTEIAVRHESLGPTTRGSAASP